MNWDAKQHSYEEIRQAIVDILLGEAGASETPNQWASLIGVLADILSRRDGMRPTGLRDGAAQMHPADAELAGDAFWNLFRQGMITLGLNDSNPAWPWFRLSHLGKQELQSQSPLRFYDSVTLLSLVLSEVSDISSEARRVSHRGCRVVLRQLPPLAVMLGVAAEAEFLRLVETAAAHPIHGSRFNSAVKAEFFATKIERFTKALESIKADLPKGVVENLSVNLSAIQAVIRTARNYAGHPVASSTTREQVYVHLQLFVPVARQMRQLRVALALRSTSGS